jgi:nucleoside-diphosphate-sugar epimerase
MTSPQAPCPRCSSDRIKLSHSRNIVEKLLKTFGIRAYRCIHCGWRGFRIGNECKQKNKARYSLLQISHLTVAEMADRLIKYWGDGKWEDLSDPQALHEAKFLKLNCDKAHAGLNWHSVLTINECLQMTAEWYKIFYAGSSNESAYKFCTQQIAEYGERAKSRNLIWTK